MADVRLTATNPEDSSVVPVACNEKGELKLEEPIGFDGTLDGDLTVSGRGTFARGHVTLDYANIGGTDVGIASADQLAVVAPGVNGSTFIQYNEGGTAAVVNIAGDGNMRFGSNITNAEGIKILLSATDGSAQFGGEVVVTSRNAQWTLVESGGLCHMVENTRSTALMSDAEPEYPDLRDVFKELDMIESALQEVMEKLRMAPPAGWEVWDGST